MRKRVFAFMLFISCGLMFFSCKSMYKIIYGVKNPKVENYQSVQDSYNDHFKNVPGLIFVPKDSTSFWKLLDKIKGYPRVQLFDNRGFLIKFQDTGYCYARATDFCSTLTKDTIYRVDTNNRLNDLLELVSPIKDTTNKQWQGYDFIFTGYWSVSIGRMNKNVSEVYNAVSKHGGLKILYLFFDIDLMEEWDCVSLKKVKSAKHNL
jgi:hypothetical protein